MDIVFPILFSFLLFQNQFSVSSSSLEKTVFLLPLTHSLSNTQFNETHHLLNYVSTRSTTRFHRHHHRNNRRVSLLPLLSGSDYTLSFNLGSSQIVLYLDTGSDLVWFPCQPFDCILCESEEKSPYHGQYLYPPVNLSSTASTVPCDATACSAAHSTLSSASDLCAIARCPLDFIETSDCGSFSCPPFYYAYGDGSLIGNLYRDSLTLHFSSNSITLRNFTFGCAHTALAEPVGVAGFGQGVLSFPAQLSSFSPELGNGFSYCLISHSFDSDRVRIPSPLILGRNGNGNGDEGVEFVYTKILDNPKHPYLYSVALNGITVGKENIPAPEYLTQVDIDGTGGMVVDSGTTFTMLPADLFNSVVTEFDRRVGKRHRRASQIEERTGLSPCYYYNRTVKIPNLVLHFAGKGSSVMLPRKNYFYEFLDGGDGVRKKRNVGCLMLMNGGDEKELVGGPGATLGNYQQQGFEVVYDLEEKRIGFAKRQCASLWERSNKG